MGVKVVLRELIEVVLLLMNGVEVVVVEVVKVAVVVLILVVRKEVM